MADANQVTLRSDKTQFLTFEEMDRNLLELKDNIIELNYFTDVIFENYRAQFDASLADTAKLTTEDNEFQNNNEFAGNTYITGSQIVSGNLYFNLGGTFKFPVWTTSTRPSSESASVGFNLDFGDVEYFDGVDWAFLGGSRVSPNTTSNNDLFIPFTETTSGSLKQSFVNPRLSFNPANNAAKVDWVMHPIEVVKSITIPAGYATVTGTKDILAGVTVDVEDGGEWTVV